MKKRRIILGVTTAVLALMAIISCAAAFSIRISDVNNTYTPGVQRINLIFPLYVISLFFAISMVVCFILFIISLIKKAEKLSWKKFVVRYISILSAAVVIVLTAGILMYCDNDAKGYDALNGIPAEAGEFQEYKEKYEPILPFNDMLKTQTSTGEEPKGFYNEYTTFNSVYACSKNACGNFKCYSELLKSKSTLMIIQFRSQISVPIFNDPISGYKAVAGETGEKDGVSYFISEYRGDYEIRVYEDGLIYRFRCNGFSDIYGFDENKFVNEAIRQYEALKMTADESLS